MSLFKRRESWRSGLPPIRAARIRTRRGLSIPLPGGGRLLADRHHPADDERAPVVLMRTPYGRRANTWMARLIARRGYQVLLVSTGGTGGSGGTFRGWLLNEREPRAIMDWLRARPWFCGAMATWGASFLGYTQWQMGTERFEEWRAALIQDAPPEVHRSFLYRGGAFALGDWLRWAQQTRATAGRDPSLLRGIGAMLPAWLRGRRAMAHLPVTGSDRVLAGETIGFFQEWLAHPRPDAPLWAAMDHTANAARLPPIVHLAGAWYDPFLPGVLAGEAALRSGAHGARRRVRLLIGPWTHGWGLFTREYLSEAFAVLDHALRGEGELPAAPVKLRVGGEGGAWQEYPRWPPPSSTARRLYLHPEGGLGFREPPAAVPTALRYDPAAPTPSIGGPVLFGGGAKDSRALVGRGDVAAFAGGELTRAMQAVGEVRAEVHLRSALAHADVFVRLCDIGPAGEWTHVCDGIVRLGGQEEGTCTGVASPDTARTARVELWPTAHRFAPGHRIGVLVAAGAHPRYDRNLGTGDQRGTAMRANGIEILHDAEHPSALVLPLHPC